jgi:uncharacterized membrane protein
MAELSLTLQHSRRSRWPDWLLVVIVLLILLNGLPFLAPIFMKLGWETPGRAIYFLYSFMCHQMAQRSFFLFGPRGFQMYGLNELPVDLRGLTPVQAQLALRLFLGSDGLGWKVAWSDRMVYMYTAPLLVALGYATLRRRGPVRPLPLWGFLLLLLPMALDGGTHWLSDLAGIGQGFRDSNLWLASLTRSALPAAFYAGDSLGSFNSLMRLLSGVTFGVAVCGLLFPWVDVSSLRADAAPGDYGDIQPITEANATAPD